MFQAILDPGNIYVVGLSFMSAFVAVVLYFAKRSLDKSDDGARMSMKPVTAALTVSAVMAMAAVSRATVFADFYNAHSIYVPA